MRTCQHDITVTTSDGITAFDITPEIRHCIEQSGMLSGLVSIESNHVSLVIGSRENKENLLSNIRAMGKIDHGSHDGSLAAMLMGGTEVIPLSNGELSLDSWQSILLLEHDGPKNRRILLQISGE